jgi:hypothetical protein
LTDRLTLTRALEGAGIKSEAAERVATEIYDAIHDNSLPLAGTGVATKADVAAVRADMREMELRLNVRIDLIEHRLMTRLGGLIAVATGILIAIKYFG